MKENLVKITHGELIEILDKNYQDLPRNIINDIDNIIR